MKSLATATLARLAGLACLLVPVLAGAETLKVPGDAPSIGEALKLCAAGDVIELTSTNPYRERIDLTRAAKGLTLRAAKDTTVTLLGDAGVFEAAQADGFAPGKLIILNQDVTLQRIHFMIDATDLAPWNKVNPYQIVWISKGKAKFEDCSFEIAGKPKSDRVLADDMTLVENPGTAEFDRCSWSWHDLGFSLPDGASYLSIRGETNVVCSECDFKSLRADYFWSDVWVGENKGIWPDPPEGAPLCSTALRITGGALTKFDACQFGEGPENAAQAYCQIFNHGVPVRFEGCVFGKGYRHGVMMWGKAEETATLDRCIVQASMLADGRFLYAQPGPPMRLVEMRNSVYEFDSSEHNVLDCTKMRVVRLEQCNIVDIAGLKGSTIVRVMETDSTTSKSVEIRNCAIVAPKMATTSVVYDVDQPGRPIAEASGNMILRKGFARESLPEGSYVEADPRLAIDMAHLLADSPAIGAAKGIGLNEDLDRDPRPAAKTSIGADQPTAVLDLPPWIELKPDWKADAPTTASQDLLDRQRVQIMVERRDLDAVTSLSQAFLRAFPNSPHAPRVMSLTGEAYYWRTRYAREKPERLKAIGEAKVKEWEAAEQKAYQRFISATYDYRGRYFKDMTEAYTPVDIALSRLYIMSRMNNPAALANEADRALKEVGGTWKDDVRFKSWKAGALAGMNPPQYEAGLAILEDIISGDQARLLELSDQWTLTMCYTGSQLALNLKQPERAVKFMDLVKKYPTELPLKQNYMLRFEKQINDGIAAKQAGGASAGF